MRDNDLSNTPMPRIAVVFEGALGFLKPDRFGDFWALMDKTRYRDALELWDLNDLATRIIWDRVWRDDLTIDVITYLGPDAFARELAEYLGREELPVNQVWATTPKILARKLPLMPDLIRVYDPDPEHQWYFPAAVGRHLTDANQIGRL
jgi:hypothetical protein